ncbi:MAG: diacylglycerol kinase family protein [Deltaproteobacteria bacterium]|nr:diacylglycerol kinase family protein [Deltaproteobacteria bacterium]
MSGIGVILNPYSRSNRKNPGRAERLGFIVGDKGSCHATRDISDVERLAQEFKDRGVEILGISGGDGTYQKTLTTFIKIYGETPLPQIAFLGGGTMNNVVHCMGIRGTPEMILSRLIYKYHEDTPSKMSECPLLKVNEIYGFLFGNGLLYRFLCDFNKVDGPTQWTAAWMLLEAMCHALANSKRGCELCRKVDAEVTVDGKLWPFKNYTTIFAGTVETLGLGFDALYRARKVPGKFQLLSFSLPPRQVVWSFPRLLLGKPVPSENWLDDMAGEVVIKTKEPEGFMLDGELYPETTEVRLSLGPQLKIIVE